MKVQVDPNTGLPIIIPESQTTIVGGGSRFIEGTNVKSTGETGGTKYLREDGDGTSSWQPVAGGGTSDHAALSNLDYASAGHTGFATSAQGSLANSATQPLDNVSTLTNDAGYLTSNAVDSVNTKTGVVVINPDDLVDTTTTNKFVTASDKTKLSNLSGTNTGDQTLPTSVDDLSPSQTGNGGKFLKTDGTNSTWTAIPGGGDMLAATYDPTAIGASAFDMDNMVQGTTKKYVSATDVTNLGNLSGTNTGDQNLTTYQLKPTEGAFANGDKTKLDGIATGATANSSDATLLARANHTGTQAVGTITGLATVATTGAYSDITGTPTIPIISDTAYNATSWNTNTDGASKNAIRDKVETMDTAIGLNTAKVSYPSGDATKVGHISVTQAVNLDTIESDTATNNAKVGITPTQASNITSNNAKISFDSTSSTRLANTSGTNTGDNATNTQYSGLVSNATHTGDVTGATALTIAANAVTNAKSAQMATKTYKGRTTAGTGNSEDVAVATLKTDLVLVKGDVGLGNVDNTSDATKNSAVASPTNKDLSSSTNTFPDFYPVGTQYVNLSNSANPSTYLPGQSGSTWVADSGTVTVAKAAAGTFDTAGATGGAETVAGASHSHDLSDSGQAQIEITASGNALGRFVTANSWNSNFRLSATAGSNATGRVVGAALDGATDSASPSATSVLQPYKVKYVWNRTA